jgi:ubiquinone/menaquinone biosynthesis C-methylase UbiE
VAEIYESEEYLAKQRSLHVADETDGDAMARRRAERSLRYLHPTDWLLDIGCKTGAEQGLWREHGILNTIGLDLWPEKAMDRGLAVIRHDMHVLPFGDGAFNVVYCRDTLEHSPNPERVMAEIFRVLRPNGLLFLSGPVWKPEEYHYSLFTVEDYRKLLTDFGFLEMEEEIANEPHGDEFNATCTKDRFHGI